VLFGEGVERVSLCGDFTEEEECLAHQRKRLFYEGDCMWRENENENELAAPDCTLQEPAGDRGYICFLAVLLSIAIGPVFILNEKYMWCTWHCRPSVEGHVEGGTAAVASEYLQLVENIQLFASHLPLVERASFLGILFCSCCCLILIYCHE
jgi:hypothetical protein